MVRRPSVWTLLLLVIAGAAVARDPEWARNFLEHRIVPVAIETTGRFVKVIDDARQDFRFLFDEIVKRLPNDGRPTEKRGNERDDPKSWKGS